MSPHQPAPEPRPTDDPFEVLVVGEALIDVVRRGTEVEEHVGGSPANVALGLGRLGRAVRLRTALGDDERGMRVLAHLGASGVMVDPASVLLERTSTAEASVGAEGTAAYRFDIDWRVAGELRLGAARHVHVGSVACFLEPGASRVLSLLESIAGIARVSFDPNIRPAVVGDRERVLERVDRLAAMAQIVKLSDEDAAWLHPGWSVEAVLARLRQHGAALAVATLGSSGALLSSSEVVAHVAAPAVEVRDTVGAGDTFMAALIDALGTAAIPIDETRLQAVGEYAAAAAAITVSRAGAALPTRDELRTPRP